MYSFIFNGYWEEIGTASSFFEANIRLPNGVSPFNFYDREHVIYTHARFLLGSKVNRSVVDQAVVSDGVLVVVRGAIILDGTEG